MKGSFSFFKKWDSYVKLPEFLRISGKDVEETLMGLGLEKGAKVLDLGCGYGRIAVLMKEKGFDVLGVDSSQKMVDNAKGKFDCALMDAEHLKLEDNSFDLVLTDGLLEHVEKPEKILSEEFRVSRRWVVNFIPQATLFNKIMEVPAGSPKVFWRTPEYWLEKHNAHGKTGHRKLKRLDAFVCKK